MRYNRTFKSTVNNDYTFGEGKNRDFSMRVRCTRGLGYHAVVKEVKVLFPEWTALTVKMLVDSIFTRTTYNVRVESVAMIAAEIAAVEEKVVFRFGSQYLTAEEIATGLLEMARGKSFKKGLLQVLE